MNEAASGLLKMKNEKKLVLGSAGQKHPDALTLDVDPAHQPDFLHDLNKVPWPFADNQFHEIICHHVLEHLNDLPPAMDELHRICDSSGSIYIEIPHHSSWMAHTPEHKLCFNFFSFDGYLENGVTEWMTTRKKFRALQKEITFHKSFRKYFLHRWFNRFPLAYERFWTYLVPAEHLKLVLKPIK